MSFDELLDSGRITHHSPSRREIRDLLVAVARDLTDARAQGISVDRQFMAAYEGGLGLCMIALAASGYRARASAHHVTVIEALPLSLGDEFEALAIYLDDCRETRHDLTYERVGLVSQTDVSELIDEVECLRHRVLAWLAEENPELLPEATEEK